MSLQVNVIEAKGLAAADSNGFSDPYAVVILGTQSVKTKTKMKTLNPVWNEIFNLRMRNDDWVIIEVWDWDALSSDDFLGMVRVNLRELRDDEGPTWYALEGRDGGEEAQGQVSLRIRTVSTMQNSKSYDTAVNSVQNRMKNLRVGGMDDEDDAPLKMTKIPPESVTTMMESNIKRIDFSFNSFTTLPDLGAVSLREITASGNPIIDIAAVGYMTTLTKLILNGAQLTEIPPAIGKLKLLEKLEVGNNQVAKLPAELGRLNKLEELSLTGNPLVTVPPHMGGLISLEILDLSNCEITKLPEEFTLMTRLMELNLGNNRIEALPQGIGRMTRLVSLNVMDNELSDLPLSIGHCIGLGKIGSGIALARNPIINQDMFAKYKIGVDHLLDWLEKRLQLEGPAVMPNVTLPADLWPPGEKRTGSGLIAPGSPSQARPAAKPAAAPSSPSKTHVAPVPARTLTPQEIDQQLGVKVVALKNWGITTMRNEVRPKLIKMKLGLNRPGLALNDLVAIGQAVKGIKAEADKNVPFVQSRTQPQFMPSPADRTEALKIVIGNTIDDVVFIVDGLQNTLQTTVITQDVLLAVQATKILKPMVLAAPPNN